MENLVIIPGWREKKESFAEVKELLKDYFNIFVIDLPGFETKLEKPYYLDDYLDYLNEKLKDLENFYLLGHSFGGALALLYTLKNKDKVKVLILYNAAILREKNLKKKFVYLLAKILKPFETIFPLKIRNFLKKIFYRLIVKSYDYFLVDENLKKTMINIYQDLRNEAKILDKKTILLWGENDKITTLKQAQTLKNLIKDSQLIILKGGHSLHKENPKKFAEVLKNIKV